MQKRGSSKAAALPSQLPSRPQAASSRPEQREEKAMSVASRKRRRHCGVLYLRRGAADFPTGAVQFCEGIKIVRLAAGGTAQSHYL